MFTFTQDGETALHKACKMCNYDVLKCLMDFAKQNNPGEFKKYINAVNVKVKWTRSIYFSYFIHTLLQGESALHYLSIQPLSPERGNVSIT